MKLRTRLFFLVGGLFSITMIVLGVARQIQVAHSLHGAANKIHQELHKMDQEKRQDIFTFLGIQIMEVEMRINALLGRIAASGGLQTEQNDWGHSAKLIMNNQWVDFVQRITHGKLTSRIETRPPFLQDFVKVPIDEQLTVIVGADDKGGLQGFIGAPHPNDGKTVYFLFTVDQVPVETFTKHPELLKIFQSPDQLSTWLREKIGTYAFNTNPMPEPSCNSYLCKNFKEGREEWFYLRDWSERDDQNELLVAMTTIPDGRPFSQQATKGAVVFSGQTAIQSMGVNLEIGYGVYSQDVFFNQPIPIEAACSLAGQKTCITDEMQLYTALDRGDIYLTNSLVSNDSLLTVGVNIVPILRDLAIAIPDQIFFVTNSGASLSIDTHGLPEDPQKWKSVNYQDMIAQEEGIVVDNNGSEYYYLHITPITKIDGHVFVIQVKDSELSMVAEVNEEAKKLDRQIIVQYIGVSLVALSISLFLLNHIINHITNPIRQLAIATEQVGSGNYSQIVIPDRGKGKPDEVGKLIGSFTQMIEDLKRGDEVRGILDKVVSKQIAKKILSEGIALGGEQREVTILFSDVRNFTHIAQNMKPQEVFEMLNDSLTHLSRVIDDNDGVIDKYVGDEIMALFGAPVVCENGPLRAIECAKMMRAVQIQWNELRQQRGLIPLTIGIAVNTGEVIAGNVGAENHRSYTVLGHNVNLTSRICDYAGPMEIIISDTTYNAPGVKEIIAVDHLGPVNLKGITEPVILHRVR